MVLNIYNGATLWEQSLSEGIKQTPLISSMAVYCGSTDGHFYAYSLDEVNLLFSQEYDMPILQDMTYTNSRIFFRSGDTVHVLNSASGEEIFSVVGEGVVHTPSVISGTFVMFEGGSELTAFNYSSGSTLWNYP
jgi:outer membrane protein assembly factor BamB